MKKLTLLFIMFLFFALPCFSQQEKQKPVLKSELGKVISIETFENGKSLLNGEVSQKKQTAEVKIISGDHKGENIFVTNMIMGNPAYDIDLKKGDKIILHAEQTNGGIDFFVADKHRTGAIYFLIGIFSLLVLAIGKKKGLFSLISILITLAMIFWGLTPLILSGFNPIFATVLICVLSSIIAIYLVGGLNYKSTSAILATIISVIFAGVLSALTIKLAHLTGFSGEENLFLFSAHPNLNFVGILASAMIIGALGAVMDIGMSISSTVNEIYSNNKNLSLRELFKSGMNVGQDIIGMMANTLILAYLGGALSLVLLSENIDLQKFFNLNQVATEISSALIGSIALVICVPVTAIIAAYLIKKHPQTEIEKKDFDDIM